MSLQEQIESQLKKDKERKEKNKDLLIHVGEGLIKGFLLYFVPATVLTKSISVENAKNAGCISLLVGTTRLVEKIFREYPKESLYHKFRYAISGAIGSTICFSLNPELCNSLIGSFLLVRVLRYFTPEKYNSKWNPIIALCFGSAQVFSSFLKSPNDLANYYNNFLIKQTALSPEALQKLGSSQIYLKSAEDLIHPNSNFFKYWITLFVGGFFRALKVYLALTLVKTFGSFYKTKSIPFVPILLSWFRSALFLTTFCTAAIGSLDVVYKIFPGITRLKLFLHLWIPGFALLIQNEQSRIEQACWVCSFGVDSLYRTIKRSNLKFLENNKKLHSFISVVSFVLIISGLLHQSDQVSNVVTSGLLGFNEKK
eukprot:TRINITY_DN616_c0_g2_i1.p1 TRINITY_DN616_c0_g2~~TRINITY_DN616_c0_g2_i1.p1  ORF type:complete len:369 (+),score=97.00 TRINITY_DN616_c0_g2_i1:62-1168(+)